MNFPVVIVNQIYQEKWLIKMLSMLFLANIRWKEFPLVMLHVYVMELGPIQLLYYFSSSTGMEEMSKPHFLLSFFYFHKMFCLHYVQVMSVKALGTALKLTFEGNNQLLYPETWFFVFIVTTCVITQMNYLNKVRNVEILLFCLYE